MHFLLTDLTNKLDFGEALVFGGQILLIGMLTVFSVLFLLWVTMIIFKFFFHDLGKKNTKTKVVTVEETPTYNRINTLDEEIVAVIAAAIAMAESESNNGQKFRVVSFRRK